MRKILLTCLCTASVLLASEVTIDQKNNSFSKKEIRLKVGDTIKFTNSDPFVHNAYTDDEKNEFDLGSQKPNETKTVTAKEKGMFLVECVVHPDMALNVIVE